jgi:hypothetical protein
MRKLPITCGGLRRIRAKTDGMMKRLILYLGCLLLAMPIWAWQETVTVGADETETLPTSVSERVQYVADALGLTLLGWTPGEVADGQRPTTYYGLGATETPAVETTYYAMFARADEDGQLMIRQCASPANGDTVLLATTSGASCWLPENSSTSDMTVVTKSSDCSASLLMISDLLANNYSWVYVVQPDSKFRLQSVRYPTFYLIATASVVKCWDSGDMDMQISSGFLSCEVNKTLQYLYVKYVSPKYFWKPKTSAPEGQRFSFYRKERYVDFATTIGQIPGCANCFIVVP